MREDMETPRQLDAVDSRHREIGEHEIGAVMGRDPESAS